MTGARIGAADLVWSGLATHFCPSSDLPELEAALRTAAPQDAAAILAALPPALPPALPAQLPAHLEEIRRCFAPEATDAGAVLLNLVGFM